MMKMNKMLELTLTLVLLFSVVANAFLAEGETPQPLTVTVNLTSPVEGETYRNNTIRLAFNYTANSMDNINPVFSYHLDGQGTIVPSIYVTPEVSIDLFVADGEHYISVEVSFSHLNGSLVPIKSNSEVIHFYVDTITSPNPPNITIISPAQNIIVTGLDTSLVFYVPEPISWAGYSVNNRAVVAISGNTSMFLLGVGLGLACFNSPYPTIWREIWVSPRQRLQRGFSPTQHSRQLKAHQ
jgi:hypothetical protein